MLGLTLPSLRGVVAAIQSGRLTHLNVKSRYRRDRTLPLVLRHFVESMAGRGIAEISYPMPAVQCADQGRGTDRLTRQGGHDNAIAALTIGERRLNPSRQLSGEAPLRQVGRRQRRGAGRNREGVKADDGSHVTACRGRKYPKSAAILPLIPLIAVRLYVKMEDT